MSVDPWAEPEPDPRVERVARRLYHLFGVGATLHGWERLQTSAKASWLETARQVVAEADQRE